MMTMFSARSLLMSIGDCKYKSWDDIPKLVYLYIKERNTFQDRTFFLPLKMFRDRSSFRDKKQVHLTSRFQVKFEYRSCFTLLIN